MGNEKKSRHLLGLAIDRNEPGLDTTIEVREIVNNVISQVENGELSASTAGRILGALKRAIKKSSLSMHDKAAALGIVSEGEEILRSLRKTRKRKKK